MKTISLFIVTIVLAFLFVLITPAEIFCQTPVKHKPADTEKDMLCHKWNIRQSENSNGLLPGISLSTIKFLPEGDVVFSSGKQVQGVWNYDAGKNALFIIVNNKRWTFKVLALTNQQLVLENTMYKSTIKNYLWRENF